MTITEQPAPPRPSAKSSHRTGAPLLPPTLAYAALTVAATVIPRAVAGEAPWASDSALLDFYRNHGAAAHTSAYLTLGAAIPLAILTAVSTTRLRTLGLDVPGRIIAQIGGTVASALLALSGLSIFALTQPHVAQSNDAIHVLNALSVAAGGPGYVMFSGLLLAGLAISGLLGRVLPRGLAWAGIGSAVICELASLAVAADAFNFLLPVGRFTGLAWLVAIGFTLPATRRQLRERRGITRPVDAA